jgi:hypothetical protein
MISVEQVTSSTGWIQVALESGILVAILGAIFATGRWVGGIGRSLEDVTGDVSEIKSTTATALDKINQRIDPLERDYWRRVGRAEGVAEERRQSGG